MGDPMEKQFRQDLKISGTGNASGGIFDNLTIEGEGKINGNLDCVDFIVSGVADVNGNLRTKTGKISGKAIIKGNLYSEDFKISGRSEIQGSVTVKEMTIEGTAEIKGGFRAEEAEIRGTLRVKGDCQAEVFVAKGAFTIGGLLNAGSIDIMLYGNCTARQIGGEKINIRKDRSSRLIRFIESIFPNTDDLTTESVEGDDIYLEYTKAKVVRGNNVNIGPGCEIELVEYGNDFQQVKEATVKDSKRII